MKRVLITFGGAKYDKTVKEIVERAPKMGADSVWVYDEQWLMQTEFYRLNHWLWEGRGICKDRGFGWWCWKPFVILEALDRLEIGDVVLFIDADTFPIHDFSMLYDECVCAGGAMLFEAQGWIQHRVCKRDCFIVMGQDEERYHNAQAAVARFMLFQKGPWKPQQFLMEWLTYNVNPLAITYEPSVIGRPEMPELWEHRAEQSILTNLSSKYGYRLYREACQFGDNSTLDRDLYPTLFHQIGADKADPSLAGSAYRNMPTRTQ